MKSDPPDSDALLESLIRPIVEKILAEKQESIKAAPEPRMTAMAVAIKLKTTRANVYRLAALEKIPGHKLGKFWYFYESEIDDAIKNDKCSK